MDSLTRKVFSSVAHHVTHRGNRHLPVFFSDDDPEPSVKVSTATVIAITMRSHDAARQP